MTTADRRVTRDDIEAKLAELAGDVEAEVANVRGLLLGAAVAAGLVIVAVAFAWGRRRGRRLATIVEIRRV